MENEMKFGDIYLITAPNEKKYIGQCVKRYKNRRKHGYKNRFKQHIRDSINKNCCRLLGNCIKKYNILDFKLELLGEYLLDELDYWENYYIEKYNTFSPNGLNLITGKSKSRQSKETRELKRDTMLKIMKLKREGKYVKNKKEKINSNDYLNYGEKKIKKDKKYYRKEYNKDLPRYISKTFNKIKEHNGYKIYKHPKCKHKAFTGKQYTLEEKLKLAINYKNKLDGIEDNIEEIQEKEQIFHRKSHNKELPKYIIKTFNKNKEHTGYKIFRHPKCKCKCFTAQKYTMDEKLNKAIHFLTNLNDN